VVVDVQSRVCRSPSAPDVRRFLGRVRRSLSGKSGVRGARSGAKGRELSVLFCGDARMRRLNRVYRGKDKTTDVLAFPAGAGALLGDIVVSVPYAARQARRRGERASREIDRLLLHGYLHLLGYDHETDSGEMDALEARTRLRLGLSETP
jgi:probable rRNA maturation factor